MCAVKRNQGICQNGRVLPETAELSLPEDYSVISEKSKRNVLISVLQQTDEKIRHYEK